MNHEHRIALLENKIMVMQREVNEVLGQTQELMATLAQSLKIAVGTLNARLEILEAANKPQEVRTDEVGKEI